jgi:hypothetical protein
MIGSDLYLKITNNKGVSHVEHHRVWDPQRFIQSITNQFANAKDPKDRCKVEVTTKPLTKKGN